MKKIRWLLIILVLIFVIVGGKKIMDHRKEQKELDVEKQSVKVLKKTFADVAKVEVERTGYNNMTGFYRMVVRMTNKDGKTVRFDYGFVKGQNELSTIGLVDEKVQKEGITTTKIKVIYSNGEEEEI